MLLLTSFLSKIYRRFYESGSEGVVEDPEKDEKLQKLLQLVNENPLIKGQKVLIFTEFRDTARYLERRIRETGIDSVEQVDSGRNVKNREEIIQRFAPFYNCFNSGKLLEKRLQDGINILISTDVLSEGLNLQDASLLINYDLHWNPVRLMQRIGRLDRRLDPEIEAVFNRPDMLNGKMYFWNFLPPDELETLLGLMKILTGKILRINRILGIEGSLLKPDDPDMTIKEFNASYEKTETTEELMNLERQRLEAAHPELWKQLAQLPRRLFSGKQAAAGFETIVDSEDKEAGRIQPNQAKGLFCCYRMPPVVAKAADSLFEVKQEQYKPEKHPPGEVRWYFWDEETGKVSEQLEDTWSAVRCTPGTERNVVKGVTRLADARKKIEKHIRNTFLRDVQAPIGMKPTLLAWMEVN